jgi:hypothetical protein
MDPVSPIGNTSSCPQSHLLSTPELIGRRRLVNHGIWINPDLTLTISISISIYRYLFTFITIIIITIPQLTLRNCRHKLVYNPIYLWIYLPSPQRLAYFFQPTSLRFGEPFLINGSTTLVRPPKWLLSHRCIFQNMGFSYG